MMLKILSGHQRPIILSLTYPATPLGHLKTTIQSILRFPSPHGMRVEIVVEHIHQIPLSRR